jgi:hypothetical protein
MIRGDSVSSQISVTARKNVGCRGLVRVDSVG